MSTIDKYPNLKNAALKMAYCNGAVNRQEDEEQYLASQDTVLATFTEDKYLSAVDTWLATLTEAEVETLVDGEQEDMVALANTGPANVNELLDELFNNI